ncbi:UbiA family prenyltransferase [bacterium]|jgi:4-hydroxybenzoate polyprenyltransferase|nr:UbiA family prenyltransferase [bacterium]MBT4495292.1 UbiA family prenyltransferase [bacterium]MBT5401287.1 UbiA family prenyltransferase [bacterium]MBT5942754.1 UbiA family prenyltransferase [bacterium]MBT6067761.1 UbiA family prenyltransferase [bacterium]
MYNLILLIKTSRPIYWLIQPLIFTVCLFYSGADLNYISIIQLILLSFPLSLIIYGINDIYDFESDQINPRKRLVNGIVLKQENHKRIKTVSYILIAILIISSIITLNIENIISMIVLLFFIYFYSAPPIRFKERPPLDSLANIFIYIIPPAFLGYSFGSSIFDFDYKIYVAALCLAAFFIFSTIMDYTPDKKAGDKTFSVLYGKRIAALVSLIITILVYIFANFNTQLINYYLLLCITLYLIILIKPNEKLASIFFKIIYFCFYIIAFYFLYLFI